MCIAYLAFPKIILCKYIKTWIHTFSKAFFFFFLGTHIFAFECQVHLPVIVINLGLYKFFHILWFPFSRSIILNYVWKSTVQIAERKHWALFIAEAFFPLKPFFCRLKELNSREKNRKTVLQKLETACLVTIYEKRTSGGSLTMCHIVFTAVVSCAKKYQ